MDSGAKSAKSVSAASPFAQSPGFRRRKGAKSARRGAGGKGSSAKAKDKRSARDGGRPSNADTGPTLPALVPPDPAALSRNIEALRAELAAATASRDQEAEAVASASSAARGGLFADPQAAAGLDAALAARGAQRARVRQRAARERSAARRAVRQEMKAAAAPARGGAQQPQPGARFGAPRWLACMARQAEEASELAHALRKLERHQARQEPLAAGASSSSSSSSSSSGARLELERAETVLARLHQGAHALSEQLDTHMKRMQKLRLKDGRAFLGAEEEQWQRQIARHKKELLALAQSALAAGRVVMGRTADAGKQRQADGQEDAREGQPARRVRFGGEGGEGGERASSSSDEEDDIAAASARLMGAAAKAAAEEAASVGGGGGGGGGGGRGGGGDGSSRSATGIDGGSAAKTLRARPREPRPQLAAAAQRDGKAAGANPKPKVKLGPVRFVRRGGAAEPSSSPLEKRERRAAAAAADAAEAAAVEPSLLPAATFSFFRALAPSTPHDSMRVQAGQQIEQQLGGQLFEAELERDRYAHGALAAAAHTVLPPVAGGSAAEAATAATARATAGGEGAGGRHIGVAAARSRARGPWERGWERGGAESSSSSSSSSEDSSGSAHGQLGGGTTGSWRAHGSSFGVEQLFLCHSRPMAVGEEAQSVAQIAADAAMEAAAEATGMRELLLPQDHETRLSVLALRVQAIRWTHSSAPAAAEEADEGEGGSEDAGAESAGRAGRGSVALWGCRVLALEPRTARSHCVAAGPTQLAALMLLDGARPDERGWTTPDEVARKCPWAGGTPLRQAWRRAFAPVLRRTRRAQRAATAAAAAAAMATADTGARLLHCCGEGGGELELCALVCRRKHVLRLPQSLAVAALAAAGPGAGADGGAGAAAAPDPAAEAAMAAAVSAANGKWPTASAQIEIHADLPAGFRLHAVLADGSIYDGHIALVQLWRFLRLGTPETRAVAASADAAAAAARTPAAAAAAAHAREHAALALLMPGCGSGDPAVAAPPPLQRCCELALQNVELHGCSASAGGPKATLVLKQSADEATAAAATTAALHATAARGDRAAQQARRGSGEALAAMLEEASRARVAAATEQAREAVRPDADAAAERRRAAEREVEDLQAKHAAARAWRDELGQADNRTAAASAAPAAAAAAATAADLAPACEAKDGAAEAEPPTVAAGNPGGDLDGLWALGLDVYARSMRKYEQEEVINSLSSTPVLGAD